MPRATARAVITLALARLANAPGQASIAMGGVLSSFTLIVAMAIMVASFRVSVEDWLVHLLSADLYVRVAASGDTGGLRPDQQAQLAAVDGVKHAAFTRTSRLTLDPARPAVALLAREIDAADPGANLQLTGAALPPTAWRAGETPVWVSEAMVDLYGYRIGERLRLPLGGARSHVRRRGRLARLRAPDGRDADAHRRLPPAHARHHRHRCRHHARRGRVRFDASSRRCARCRSAPRWSLSQPGDIRARTLTIFDRSFAVTYLLEAVAIVIGLFGVAATFSAQTLARSREFGMLRHVGVTRRQILAILARKAACSPRSASRWVACSASRSA